MLSRKLATILLLAFSLFELVCRVIAVFLFRKLVFTVIMAQSVRVVMLVVLLSLREAVVSFPLVRK